MHASHRLEVVARHVLDARVGLRLAVEAERLQASEDLAAMVRDVIAERRREPKKDLISVSPDEDIVKVTRKMIKSGYKRMPVIKDGRLVGIISDQLAPLFCDLYKPEPLIP